MCNADDKYDANAQSIDQLTEFAAAKGITLSQLALAWILAQRDYIVPIPGSRKPDPVAENVAASDIVFTDEDLADIAAIAPTGGHGC